MRLAIVVALAVSVLPAGAAVAQVAVQDLLSPEMGKLRPLGAYHNTYYFDSDVGRQNARMQWLDYDLRTLLPVRQSEKEEFSVATWVRALDFDTDAVLPDTRQDFPDHLWNIELAPIYRRKLNNGWIAGGTLAIGSPSDRPFASLDEVSANGTGFVRIPANDRNAWLVFLNYANDREYCRDIPLPGAGYLYEPSDRLQVLAGVPYTSLRYTPIEQVQFEANYLMARTVRTQITYIPRIWLRFYTGFDWLNDHFFRRDRSDEDDMLYYYEKRVRAGMFLALSRHAFVDVSGGWAFDRFWFEGEDYSDRGDNRIDVADGPYVTAQLIVRF